MLAKPNLFFSSPLSFCFCFVAKSKKYQTLFLSNISKKLVSCACNCQILRLVVQCIHFLFPTTNFGMSQELPN